MKSLFAFLAVSFVALQLVACPGSETEAPAPATITEAGPPDASPPIDAASSPSAATLACEAAGKLICARACACGTTGASCPIIYVDEHGFGAFNFSDEAECLDLYMRGCDACLAQNYNLPCPAERKTVDYAKCEAAMKSAACVERGGMKGITGSDLCLEP